MLLLPTTQIVSWTVPRVGISEWFTRTFVVTSTHILTNTAYGVRCAENVSALSSDLVVTRILRDDDIEYAVYLPLVLRE